MDWLGGRLAELYAREGAALFRDPWKARDDYVEVIHDRDRNRLEAFLAGHARRDLTAGEKGRALKLLEMQKNALFIYTSCGWFFDEISGLETVQVMQYAAQAMQFFEELDGEDLEGKFVAFLEKAPSNVFENGGRVWKSYVKPARVDHLRVGAHFSISSVFEEYPEETTIYCYTFHSSQTRRVEAGRVKLVSGRVRTVSDRTWDEKDLSYAVLHMGDQNIIGGVREFIDEDAFASMQDDLAAALERGDVMEGVRFIDRHFEENTYSAWHLFKDGQRRVLNGVLSMTSEGIEASYRQVYENHHALMNFLQNMNVPLPHPLVVAAEYVLDRDLHNSLMEEDLDLLVLAKSVGDIRRWSIKVDVPMVRYHATLRLRELMENFQNNVSDLSFMEKARDLIVLLKGIGVEPELWKPQNVYFAVYRRVLPGMQGRAGKGDEASRKWVNLFLDLGSHLGVRVV